MSTALTRSSDLLPDQGTLGTMLKMAETLFASRLLPADVKDPRAAFAIMQKGLELGIPPMQALTNIAVIKGKPTAGAELMLALIYRDHGDEAFRWVETSNERATASYKRRAEKQRHDFTFSLEDARTAGLSGDSWRKYPGAMLRARCISAIARMAFPDSIGGMYTPEELGAQVQILDDGDIQVISHDAATHTITPAQRHEEPEEAVIVSEPASLDPGYLPFDVQNGQAEQLLTDVKRQIGKLAAIRFQKNSNLMPTRDDAVKEGLKVRAELLEALGFTVGLDALGVKELERCDGWLHDQIVWVGAA